MKLNKIIQGFCYVYVLGQLIIYNMDNRQLYDYYMLGALIVFFLLIILKLYKLQTQPREENYKEELLKVIFTLTIFPICVCAYLFL